MVRDENFKGKMTSEKVTPAESVAVALEYDIRTFNAPRVLAVGRGHLVEKILQTAREYNIPVAKDPVLAEALGQLDVGEEIPPELYKVVAEILVFIMETDRNYGKSQ